ncbi:geranylgeranylglycerol-phosphate geranylgeranyltransferase [Marivirga sp. S37H4]|uniref:Geranylgeranylglycerol-phosphate geranylgeranyltransferase n=1 Tax=Marivirga aurantiaca TaxID=2802615 RepID=A0A934WZT9_9BACT|nr:geranylgeranylglycerol-phosphate geranylgeranyltransferase [Marivirga aurantiaca]MBK6265926.1 geranylgeranylglycerol-phosphate geranylgeranyltransferase [Marivirga aurantiaca]
MTSAQSSPKNFSLKGFFRLIRIQNLVIIVLSQYLAAIFIIDSVSIFDLPLFLLSFSTVLLAAAGYIINDYYDVKIDYINKPDRVIVGKVLKRRVVLFWHTALNFIAISIGLYLHWKIGLIHFTVAFLLWFYSNQLKRLPFIGNFIVALLTGLSISILALYYKENQATLHIYALFAFAISLIREIIKDMEDWKGDANFGCKTLPIVWGIRNTKMLLYLLIVLFYFLIFYTIQFLQNDILYYYFSGLTIFVIYFIHRLRIADTIKHYHFLSNFCKLIMLSGILSMLFF